MTDKYNQNPGFFSEEEMMKCENGTLWSQTDEEQKPVTCLGMTFPNDEARRAYFREELRKKLPELRKIEGFPIGEDDDIINLSDPPYYTACPNPWLNDFIAEWEKKKEQLKAEGKRTDDFKVKEPYASDVSEGKNNPIYNAHGYHTKVPHPAIMRYILHYTLPGDIVFDGFCGSGMTGVAAQLCGNTNEVKALQEDNVVIGVRHAICSDLSPAACHISAGFNLPFNPIEFKKKATAALNQVEKELGWMFETKVNGHKAMVTSFILSEVFTCPNCGHELTLWDAAISLKEKKMNDNICCPACGLECTKKKLNKVWETSYDKLIGKPVSQIKTVIVRVNYVTGKSHGECDASDFDYKLSEKIKDMDVPYLFTSGLPNGEKTNAIKSSDHVAYLHQFYTRRNYIYLSRLYQIIKDEPILLKWFTSTLLSLTKMNRFRFSGTGIMTGTFYIPSLIRSFVPYETLKRKIDTVIKTQYSERGNSAISILSATKLKTLKDKSIDYIFIDPPFGANIMYSELSSIWEGWLRVKTNNDEEAVVNKIQNKKLSDYQYLINRSLCEFYRVLKSGKWMTIEFSNTSASVWNSIQYALQNVGFIIAGVAAIDKKQGSFNAVTSTTAVKQDLVITCYKPSEELIEKFEKDGDPVANVWDFIGELLEHLPVHLQKDNKTTAIVERSPKILFDRLIAYYVQHGYPVPMDAQAFQAGMRERYMERDGMFFTPAQAAEYDEKKAHAPEMLSLAIIVSNEAEGIEWLKRELREPKTYQEIQPEWMQSLGAVRKGDVIPELRQLLEENFIEEPDGKWRLPNIQDDKDVEALRTKSLLREFKVYVEAAQKPKAKIKEARVEALRAGFKDCYVKKDFQTIVNVGDKIPQNLRDEDEVLLQFYDIAQGKL